MRPLTEAERATNRPRYGVQMMCWPYPQYAVWDRQARREVSRLSPDRTAMQRRADRMNAGATS